MSSIMDPHRQVGDASLTSSPANSTSQLAKLDTSSMPATILTPPTTPARSMLAPSMSRPSSLDLVRDLNHVIPDEPLLYTRSFEKVQQIGEGGWSEVYLAEEKSTQETTTPSHPQGAITPPSTPRQSRDLPHNAAFIAVKSPLHKMARKVLRREAATLTYLSMRPDYASHIVPFHGFQAESSAIIMDYLPLTLLDYITSRHDKTAPTEPIIGLKPWLSLAHSLTSSLAWLHKTGIAHGDIKPANILLRTGAKDVVTPVFCDFSSATSFNSAARREDAITTMFASPELLESYLKKDGGSSTAEADVWALGVTLLQTATGEEPYHTAAANRMQRTYMARQGMILDGMGLEGSRRARKGSVVLKVLEGTFQKDTKKRIASEDWAKDMETLMKEHFGD